MKSICKRLHNYIIEVCVKRSIIIWYVDCVCFCFVFVFNLNVFDKVLRTFKVITYFILFQQQNSWDTIRIVDILCHYWSFQDLSSLHWAWMSFPPTFLTLSLPPVPDGHCSAFAKVFRLKLWKRTKCFLKI